jgi:dolichol-phosphate mannosyltransferase
MRRFFIMNNDLVSIIIPTYNEKDNLLLLIPVIEDIKSKINRYQFEIVIVDDDSPDKTGHEIKKAFDYPWVKVIIRKNNTGLATAIKDGIEASRGSIIVGMDADFNHDPHLLPELLEKLQDHDLVVASRFMKKGGMDNKFRFVSTMIFNLMLKILFNFPLTDNASGYYAIRKNDLIKLGLEKIYQGYGEYHLRLVYLAKKAGYRLKEIPVYYKKRPYGRSKSKLFTMAKDYFLVAAKLRFDL